ncbi:uncharacterized protein G2W53_007968 [Senna tora]|uniref:Uncharacterized protein n=1 Tax=Senna tora TaxID=362788 RepID=A0A835CE79_9FABA|nr:uncharacterized protein G2W53_007968 [Senna tora]
MFIHGLKATKVAFVEQRAETNEQLENLMVFQPPHRATKGYGVIPRKRNPKAFSSMVTANCLLQRAAKRIIWSFGPFAMANAGGFATANQAGNTN